MDKLFAEFNSRVHCWFIYVREAHPDWYDGFPMHTSFEGKMAQARRARKLFGSHRKMLVDRIDGDVHRLYGGMSNTSWVLDHTGRIVFKGSWTSALELRQVLERLLSTNDGKRNGMRYSEYYKEMIDLMPLSERGIEENRRRSGD